MRHFFITFTLIAAVVSLWSCNGNEDANYEALVAKTWELQQIIAPDSVSTELPPVKIEITFSDSSTMVGFAGCNNFFGTFSTYEQDQITINPVGRTMAACPFLDFEDQLMRILPLCTSYTASESELELNDTESGNTLLFKAKL